MFYDDWNIANGLCRHEKIGPGMDGRAIFLGVQREGETLSQAASSLKKALNNRCGSVGYVVAMDDDRFYLNEAGVKILQSPALQLKKAMSQSKAAYGTAA